MSRKLWFVCPTWEDDTSYMWKKVKDHRGKVSYTLIDECKHLFSIHFDKDEAAMFAKDRSGDLPGVDITMAESTCNYYTAYHAPKRKVWRNEELLSE